MDIPYTYGTWDKNLTVIPMRNLYHLSRESGEFAIHYKYSKEKHMMYDDYPYILTVCKDISTNISLWPLDGHGWMLFSVCQWIKIRYLTC